MAIKVEIPGPLREHAGGKSEIEVTGSTVGAAIAEVVAQHPTLEPKLFQNGRLRPFINVYLKTTGNDAMEDVRYLDEMETALKDGMIVVVLPAVAGG